MNSKTVNRKQFVDIHHKRSWIETILPYQLLLPSILLIAFINLYPFVTGLLYSLKDGSLLKEGKFVGFKNYLELAVMSDFWNAIRFSLVFALFAVGGSYLLGLGLALLLNKEFPGRGFIRAALLIPWIVPSIVSIVSWRWMINDQRSLVNVALGFIGIKPILFLADPQWAVFSVCIVKIWRSYPFMMVSLLAALQSISHDLYEAAYIDGVNRWKAFWYITLPHLKQISIVLAILMSIWSFNDFDTIWLLTEGGPSDATRNLIVMAYKYVFVKNNLGLGSSMAMVALVILMSLANIFLKKQGETN